MKESFDLQTNASPQEKVEDAPSPEDVAQVTEFTKDEGGLIEKVAEIGGRVKSGAELFLGVTNAVLTAASLAIPKFGAMRLATEGLKRAGRGVAVQRDNQIYMIYDYEGVILKINKHS